MKTVFLSSKLIELIVLDLSDDEHLEKMIQFRNDKDWGHCIGRNFPYDKEKIIFYMKQSNQIILGITETGKDEICGFIMLRRINQINGTAKTTTFLSGKNQSKGYGTEALKLLLNYAFKTLNLRKINADVFIFNQKNIKRLAKLGFKQQGIMTKEYYINGEYYDDVLLYILKEDWLNDVHLHL